MKITVERSGGIAALTRVWTVLAVTTSDKSRWQPLVEACPWDAVPTPGKRQTGSRTASRTPSAQANAAPRCRRPKSPARGGAGGIDQGSSGRMRPGR